MTDNREVIFAAIWKDRHADIEVFLFEGEKTAIQWAEMKVHEHAHHPEDLDESISEDWRKAGCVYRGVYSCEGDSIRVMRVPVNKELQDGTEVQA